MQLTITSDEPIDRVVEAVSGLMGVRLVVADDTASSTADGEDDGRGGKTRH